MSTLTKDLTPSPNHYDRLMPHREIKNLLNQVMSSCYPGLKDNAIYEPLKGEARKNHGDYVCFGVLEICQKLRKNDPRLFDRKRPTDIAMEIMNKFEYLKESQKSNMIEKLILHDADILTFRLEGRWIAERIETMLNDGMDIWAPTVCAKAVFVFPKTIIDVHSNINADMVRAIYIRDALANMFLYSGTDVSIGHCDESALLMVQEQFTEKEGKIVSKTHQTSQIVLNGSSNDVYTDLATLWYGVNEQKANVMVYMTPHPLREYIEQCHNAAAKEGWLPDDWKSKATVTCCGFRTFSGEQQELPHLWHKYSLQPGSLINLGIAAGYTKEASFECAFKFACLKKQRLAECTFSFEDIDYTEGNTFVSVLKTQALVRSLIKNSPGRNLFKLNALAGRERELGLHLVEFTEVIFRACGALVPHTVCEYLCNLSKLFTCYYREVRHGENMLGMCKATEMVMNKCLHLLGIAPSSNDWTSEFVSFFHRKKATATDYHIIPSSDAHLNSRFEIFSMNVSVSSYYFDKGTIFGTISVVDAYRSADGWVMFDEEDDGHVFYFNREWHNPVNIYNGSYISLENPSCVHSIPFSSSIKVSVLLKATSENKDETYLVCNCEATADLSEFWSGHANTKCGTFKLEERDGRILLDYVLLKDAVDTTVKLTFNRVTRLRVQGTIMACYGDAVLGNKNFLGQYNAVIFKADPTKFIGYESQEELPLLKSTLAVPTNGSLKIKVFLQDVDSGDIIMDAMKEYRKSDSLNGYSIWKIEGKKGTFDFRLKWGR